jgi:hypothetical protein
MKSLLDGLPPEVAQWIHPDWQRNETEYWAVRDTLLQQYRDQWIAFANGRVLVSGASAVEVLHTAQASGLHPFVICVGGGQMPSLCQRRGAGPHVARPGDRRACRRRTAGRRTGAVWSAWSGSARARRRTRSASAGTAGPAPA